MRGLIRLIGLGIALLLVQQLLAEVLPLEFRPDLLLVFALALGLRSQVTTALLLAFALGYGVDVLSGAPAGLYALLRGSACVATTVADRVLYLRAPLPWAAYVAGYVIFDALLVVGVLWLAQPELLLPGSALLARLPGDVVLTALVAAPLYSLLLRIEPQEEPSGLLPGPFPRRPAL